MYLLCHCYRLCPRFRFRGGRVLAHFSRPRNELTLVPKYQERVPILAHAKLSSIGLRDADFQPLHHRRAASQQALTAETSCAGRGEQAVDVRRGTQVLLYVHASLTLTQSREGGRLVEATGARVKVLNPLLNLRNQTECNVATSRT